MLASAPAAEAAEQGKVESNRSSEWLRQVIRQRESQSQASNTASMARTVLDNMRLPSTREEKFRFTNITDALPKDPPHPVGIHPPSENVVEELRAIVEDHRVSDLVVVTVDGGICLELSSVDASELIVNSDGSLEKGRAGSKEYGEMVLGDNSAFTVRRRCIISNRTMRRRRGKPRAGCCDLCYATL